MEVSEGYLVGFLVISTLVLVLSGLTVVYLIYQSAQKKIEFQKELMQTSIEVSEAVQQRIGMELHDGIGPDILVAKYQVAALALDSTESVQEEIVSVQDHLDYCIQQVRSISHELIPQVLQRHGLFSGIKGFIAKIPSTDQITVQFICKGKDTDIEPEVSLSIYRIVQEGINNAVRHGEATSTVIDLTIENPNTFQLIIQDNGSGFDVDQDKKGVGLKSMQVRASSIDAKLKLDSSSAGTTIKLTKNERY